MRRFCAKGLCYIGLGLSLFGCGSSDQYEDLTQYMDEVRSRPRGQIEELPEFSAYKAFTYSAAGARSPFDEPVVVVSEREQAFSPSSVMPDTGRVKQFLEGFPFDSFKMVGTLQDEGGYQALLNLEGSVYRVKVGDYVGRNHGRVVSITKNEVQVLEIVRNGLDNWVERPRTLSIKDS